MPTPDDGVPGMLMPTRFRFGAVLLGLFVLTILVVLLAAFIPPLLGIVTLGAVTLPFVETAVFLGLVWLVLGWMFTPSVETYLGQGRAQSVPIIGPSFANPERNPAVIQDLGRKLGPQTDVGVILAGFGLALMSIGFVAYVFPVVGLAALVLLCVVVVLVSLRGFLRGSSRSAA